ncbi:MAG TPA: c-type cytochrome, partial [Chryseosolibacter sp.]
KNKWFRQTGLRQFAERKDPSLVPKLLPLLNVGDGQTALEALWAINLCGGFDGQVAGTGLHHADPFVRMWTIRLLGDAGRVTPAMSSELARIASTETHPEVRSQLAATAKRLPAADAIPIVTALLKGHDDSADPDIPLQLWWALESKIDADRGKVLQMFEEKDLWSRPTVMKTILPRLMQRCVMAGGKENLAFCARLLGLAPTDAHAGLLIAGLEEGLRGRDVTELSPELIRALKPYRNLFGGESLALEVRQGRGDATNRALVIIADNRANLGQRLSLIRIFGEVNEPRAVPVLLNLVEGGESSGAIRQAALLALQRYDQEEIGIRVVQAYPDQLRADPDVRAAALALCASRPAWAARLLDAIDDRKQMSKKFVAHTIAREDIPDQVVRQLKLLNDESVTRTAERLWPEVRLATSPEKNATLTRVLALLSAEGGNAAEGRNIYRVTCGGCHRLFDEGGNVGPDLTGYDRSNVKDLLVNIVDPGAYIREGYGAYRIQTLDGRIILGTIRSRSGSTMSVQPLSGEAVVISSDQVKDITEQKTSIMPERLLDALTDAQVRDLVAYLMKEGGR